MAKEIQIFRSGVHVDALGNRYTISNDDIDMMIANYSEVNKAPLVIGHPVTNAPAFGWLSDIKRENDIMYASFADVHDGVKEAVANKHYQKISTSFYAPAHPHNPTPGHWYPRHVGLLGATPPAIKGLENVAFSENDKDCLTVEFNEVSIKGGAASLLDGQDGAAHLAKSPLDNPPATTQNTNKESHMTDEERINPGSPQSNTLGGVSLEAREAELNKKQDALNKQTANFAETMRTTTLEATKANLAGLRDGGKISPAAHDKAVEFASALSNSITVDFSDANASATNPVTDFGKFITEFSDAIGGGTAPKGEVAKNDGTADFSEADKQTALINKTNQLMNGNPNLSSAEAATQAAKELK